jgi:endonuclease/exonuclease/phosphatase family metal-dependent hydrolase
VTGEGKPDTGTETAVRVATVNCLHGLDVRHGLPPPADAASLGVLADGLAALDADVIALQEVDRDLGRSSGLDQVAWLADRLALFGVFAAALLGDPDRGWVPPPAEDPGGGAYGVGLLSRYALTGVRRLRLPGGGAGERTGPPSRRPGWDDEPRVALRADVRVPGGPLAVTTTHLSYLPWRGTRQLMTAARLAGAGHRPAVLVGDLNLPVWVVRSCLPRWHHAGGGPTYPARAPRLRLDQLLTRGPVEPDDALTKPPLTSDHRPVVADLRMRHTGW